jgi:hypothetical protein
LPVRILVVGDVVGRPGRQFLRDHLAEIVAGERIDLVVANGENAAGGLGITQALAADLHDYGVHVITTGDHVWRRADVRKAVARDPYLLRPLNFPSGTPGSGVTTVTTPDGLAIRVINLLGRIYLDPVDCPFGCVHRLLEEQPEPAVTIVDFHAEATSEKRAMGHYLDGRATAVVGTHTHIPTADAEVLPGGTGYITDMGMCGPTDSVIGVRKEHAIARFTDKLPTAFQVAKDRVQIQGVVIIADAQTGKCLEITQRTWAV